MIDNVLKHGFQDIVWKYYRAHGRHDLPWRQPEASDCFDPYKIMVSELMLQQTQVNRVIPKYHDFLSRFPRPTDLANAKLGDVLRAWSGLGYNRRAKFLHEAAKQIVEKDGGHFPSVVAELVKLPGVGAGTAGAIMAYAYNQPVIFIETNVRTVFIHHFFRDEIGIPDKAILALVAQTIDAKRPREWYWALMDYGSYLKYSVGNLNRQSISYSKQSKFEGSLRQIRGQILRSLGAQSKQEAELKQEISDERLEVVLADLVKEGMVRRQGNKLSL